MKLFKKIVYTINAYVYSPDLDLSSLSSCELAVFGLDNAYKMKFENWFYTGPLG